MELERYELGLIDFHRLASAVVFLRTDLLIGVVGKLKIVAGSALPRHLYNSQIVLAAKTPRQGSRAFKQRSRRSWNDIVHILVLTVLVLEAAMARIGEADLPLDSPLDRTEQDEAFQQKIDETRRAADELVAALRESEAASHTGARSQMTGGLPTALIILLAGFVAGYVAARSR